MISKPATPLVLLSTLVLAAHAFVLQAVPMHFALDESKLDTKLRTFVTRSIQSPPRPQAVAQKPTPPTPSPVQSSAARSEEKQGMSPLDSVGVAMNSESGQRTTNTPARAASASTEAEAPITVLKVPGSVRLKYNTAGQSKGLNYSAKAELTWLHDGSHYDLRLVVSAFWVGSRSMTSTGQVGPEGLMPTRFSDKSRGELAAHFNQAQGKITFSANTPDIPWRKGVQDRVSVFIQLGSLLAGNPARYPVGSTLSVDTASTREVSKWVFTVEKEETLSLPSGTLATVKLVRLPGREFDQTVEIWYAPELDFLPVRNKITQSNGDFVDQQLQSTESP